VRQGKQRRVVYIVIDGCRTDAFEQAMGSGKAPALEFLRDRGFYHRESSAVFPSITPCATASLITGETPDRHGIPGQCWYDKDEERIVNYGQGPRVAVMQKISEVANDLLVNLNEKHLSREVLTLHERLEDMGLTTATTNFLVRRGRHRYPVDEKVVDDVLLDPQKPDHLLGPKEFYFADVVHGPTAACREGLGVRGKIKRMKATDEYASCVTRDLLEKDAADMILFYLHENDHLSHHHGPKVQFENLVRSSELIGNVLDALGSWERTAEEVGFVLTSDHGQTPVIKDDEHSIDLDDVFEDFDVLSPRRGKDPLSEADLAQCGNGRAGYIYLNPERAPHIQGTVIKTLLHHPGIDQVMWRVVESERGRLRFRPASNGDGEVRDERGNRWELDGDLGPVGGLVDDGLIRTPEYPLALWRIHAALGLDRVGDVVCTAKLMYEVSNIIDTKHKGEHASLHAQDSLVPFISTLDEPPLHPSTVDVAPHIVRHFEGLRSA
jgi:hypothetical protein